MITIVDDELGEVVVKDAMGERRFSLCSADGFAAVSRAWLRAGWDAKHVYSFTWMGRPVIQLPEDLIRIQELIWQTKPDVIVETGVAHGGSLIFYASILEVLKRGRVIGIDIDIRRHNREALDRHPLRPRIELIEGSSIDPEVVARARSLVEDRSVLVVLDSNHSRDHVLAELRAYAPMIQIGGYMVAADGIMQAFAGAPRTGSDWKWNNPLSAIRDFVAENADFAIEEPQWSFNEGNVNRRVTYWPDAFVRRVR